nr:MULTISPECIES: transcription termination factor Rho [Pseudonocardia]
MVLAELRQLATELNVPDISGMRKGDLIAAIKERQGGAATPARKPKAKPAATGSDGADAPQLSLGDAGSEAAPEPAAKPASKPAAEPASNGAAEQAEAPAPRARRRRAATRPAGAPEAVAEPAASPEATSTPAAEAPAAPAPEPESPAAAAVAELTPVAPAEDSAQQDRPEQDKADLKPSGDDRKGDRNDDGQEGGGRRSRTRRRGGQGDDAPAKDSGQKDAQRDAQPDSGDDSRDGGRGGRNRDNDNGGRGGRNGRGGDTRNGDTRNGDTRNGDTRNGDTRNGDTRNSDGRGDGNRGESNRGDGRGDDGGRNGRNNPGRNNGGNASNLGNAANAGAFNDDDDDDGDGRGRRGRRFRDRRRGRDRERGGSGGGGGNVDTEIRDDDVLLPVAGIVDILDNYAFVRTTGYLSGPTDVYVSMSMVRKNGLRRGDAITGAVRQPREGEQQRQKFNPLVRVDTINGRDPESARNRPEFMKLTPLYPNERLRLETDPTQLTTRVIDLVMPVGKGQRALIVSPPKAGKTMVMQAIANAITTNNPECHLMVVLVDERPEEVTDMQRSVKGEVIASTFDRPPSDHTTVAELSIERAKRLVEMGHDVVVLLDNITRLGRAYNLAAPASGRILSGGVDSTALYPPKRFLGAARNIEDGGSLTIFATALVETGSTMDTVIFEEFKGTGNAELKLDRKIADKRVFPAIDVGDSSTRKEELLMSPDEHAVMVKLRRVLAALDDQQAIDLVLDRLKKTKTNIEFLMQVAKNTPGKDDD